MVSVPCSVEASDPGVGPTCITMGGGGGGGGEEKLNFTHYNVSLHWYTCHMASVEILGP